MASWLCRSVSGASVWILLTIGEILGSSLGSLVYHLLLFLAVQAALGMAWGEWRRARNEQARRLLLAMAGLAAMRIAYIVAALIAAAGWVRPSLLLPPIERLADTASIAFLGWAFMLPGRHRPRSWDLVFGANLLLVVGAGIAFTLLWSRTPASADYNTSWQALVWGLWQIGLIFLASLAVVRNRGEGWGIFFPAMVLMLLGQMLQLAYPADVPHLPTWERLANLIVYPLLAIAIYQNIVIGLRLHSRQLQDISQASLDQIKSLLFLFDASRQMSSSLDLPAVLDNAVEGIARALQADQCAIAFPVENDPGQMRLVAIYNPARQGRGESVTFPLEYQYIVQQAIRRKKYIISEESDNVQLKVLFALMGSSEIGPLLVQPLLTDQEPIGAIIVGNSRSRRAFTPNEAKLCQSMADQVVIAIQNARRYKATQSQIEELNRVLAEERRAAQQTRDQLQKLTERLTGLQAEMEELRRREELAREARNALEIKLVSSRAEADALAERVTVLETDLAQAHANAEAQLRWHEEEIARRQADWEEASQIVEWVQGLLQGMTSGILVADAEGVIQEANVAAEILLERDSGELHGLALEAVSDDDRWRQAVATAADGEAVRLTLQIGANSLLCDITPLVAPDGTQGRVQGIVAILQDISIEVEEQRAKLEAIASSVGEMRTPITTILSYADLLLSESMGILGEAQRGFLRRIRAGAQQIAKMTDDLLQKTALDERWTGPQRQVVDVGQLIEGAVARTQPFLQDKALSLDVEVPDDLPPIQADPDYLRRVLVNLLSNACLASAVGGRISIKAARSDGAVLHQQHPDLNNNSFVIVSVRDSGGGLSDEALNRVFDRARPSQTPKGLGESGAGLALVKALVEAHGGRLWVESEQGVGTTFSFVLPTNWHQAPSPTDKPLAGSNGSGAD